MKEAEMTHASQSRVDKIEHPQAHYVTPDELIEDQDMSLSEKMQALDIWAQDARQLLTASNEGMPGSDEGNEQSRHHMLGQVERAKHKLQAK
jgi:hypothetical protein